jgi:hypothetical protein
MFTMTEYSVKETNLKIMMYSSVSSFKMMSLCANDVS